MAKEVTIQDVYELAVHTNLNVVELAEIHKEQFDSKGALKEILAYAEAQFECSSREHHERCLACQKIGTVVAMAKRAVREDG